MPCQSPSRRRFLQVGATAAAAAFVPRIAVAGSGATPPSEKLNIACVGLGWPGRKNCAALAGAHNIVALCDVDTTQTADLHKTYPRAKLFQDYRRMLDQLGAGLDALIVATPDHTHAVIAIDAIRRGKHVYCEKPLAHSIHEVRTLMKAAAEHKVITQLGNQGHSSDSIRMFCEWIWDGAIGQVHTIHAGSKAVNSGLGDLAEIAKPVPVPATFDWDIWLGPAQKRPYHPAYTPHKWRGWTPFGNGTLGDWTCHVLDPVFWALDLGAPRTILAEADDYDPRKHAEVFPRGERVTFEFAAKGKRGPVTVVWHSGTRPIPQPKDLDAGRKPVETGAVVYGDQGVITYGSHGAGGVRIIPEAKMKQYKRPAPTLPRVPRGSHEHDWARAIREGKPAGSDFAYGGPLTEIGLLGVIAIRRLGQKLEWDSAAMRFTNCAEANAFLNPPYRQGWSL